MEDGAPEGENEGAAVSCSGAGLFEANQDMIELGERVGIVAEGSSSGVPPVQNTLLTRVKTLVPPRNPFSSALHLLVSRIRKDTAKATSFIRFGM